MAMTDGLRILHMRDAAAKIIDLTDGKTLSDLEEDEVLPLALTRLTEIIGEAATNVSEGTQGRYPEIPWRRVIDTRNRLIHGYADINMEVLWEIITVHVPELLPHLQKAAEEASP